MEELSQDLCACQFAYLALPRTDSWRNTFMLMVQFFSAQALLCRLCGAQE